MKKGLSGEVSYQNPRDKLVTIRFRGLSSLIEVMDPLEDGGEIMWNERVGVSEKTIIGMIPAKERLAVFRPRPAFPSIREPNYASKEVVEELIRRLKAKPR
ncbi:MAG: hypothetical protein HYZ37_18805 [Candidatus Solibacter usitatus]|nr:hypothetical protein [Candidatus Solibacter usitatus]